MDSDFIKPVYLLTSMPGTGKTSLIRQVIADAQIEAGGFYTEEIRTQGTRLGFRLVTLDGRDAVLAHVDFNRKYSVGKYGVDIDVLENIGVPALRAAARSRSLIVLDEIGRMELLSPGFRETVQIILDSGKRMLGTIMLKPDPLVDTLKKHPNVRLVRLTRDNYDKILADVREWLKDNRGRRDLA